MIAGGQTEAVTLRDVRWQDLAALTILDRRAFGEDAWSEATWWAELAHRPRRSYVLLEDDPGHILGYGGIDIGGDVADIMSVAVVPTAQGRGFGRRILTELHQRSATAGAAYALLEVRADNEAAVALYASMGYQQIHRRPRYYQPGDVDAVIMRLPLSTTVQEGAR